MAVEFKLTSDQLYEIVSTASNEERLQMARLFGWDEQTDNNGQILFYTGLKKDEKTSEIREIRESDLKR